MNVKIKEWVRRCMRHTCTYDKEYKRLLSPYDPHVLEQAVRSAVRNVPFYKGYEQYLSEPFRLDAFPVLRKKDIAGHEAEMVSRRVCRKLLFTKETGGSSGVSLRLYNSWDTLVKMNCPADYAFSLIGRPLRLGIMRGTRPAGGAVFQRVGGGHILLSSYLLSESNLELYLDALRANRTQCLHVYPSSMSILARLIKNKYGVADLPDLKGVLSSSEIFSREERALVRSVFQGVKLIDYYGMSELTCCAIAEDDGYYRFMENFGHVEFVDTGERIDGHRVAEIVATSIANTTMPFIRYGTEDYVELDDHGNVLSIIGRTSDFVVNANGELTPCIVTTRNESMQNVLNFQYAQMQKGRLMFRVVVNGCFSEREQQLLQEDLEQSFVAMDCRVVIVADIERTVSGKQKRLVQMLNLDEYK